MTLQAHKGMTLQVLIVLALGLVASCGAPDTLQAFDVALVAESDCRQVGQGAVQCEDEQELQKISVQGRWVVDKRDGQTFLLNTHDGRVLPGIVFENNGRVAQTNVCLGDGGNCYFARTESASYDVESACSLTSQHIVDAVLDAEGNLNGLVILVTFTDEGCVNSFISERRIRIKGIPADEVVQAREEFQ